MTVRGKSVVCTRHTYRILIASLLVLVTLLAASASTGAQAQPDRTPVTVEGEVRQTVNGGPAHLPQFEQLARQADRKGQTLEAAIADHVSELVAQGHGQWPEKYGDQLSNPDISIDGIHLDELDDIRTIAERDGIDLMEAIARTAWQTDFVRFAAELEEAYRNEFAGAGVRDSGRGAWFAFAGEIPPDAIELSRKLPVPVELIGGRGFSEAELIKTLNAAHTKTLAHDDIVNVHGHYDIERGTVTIRAQPSRKGVSATLIAGSLGAQMRDLSPNPRITVEVVLVDRLQDSQDASRIRGGGELSSGTAGFTVRNPNTNWRGIATAGHVARNRPSLSYRNHSIDGGGWVTVNRVGVHEGQHGDLARYSTGGRTATATFYWNWNAKRLVTSVWSPRTGVDVCRFGKTTGRHCDVVYRINETKGDYRGLVATHRRNASSGDSGGPWYYGNTAYGIHQGSKSIWFINRDMFTPAANLMDGLGVRVITG